MDITIKHCFWYWQLIELSSTKRHLFVILTNILKYIHNDKATKGLPPSVGKQFI